MLARLIAIGLTLFTGRFLLLVLGFKAGMPADVASVTQQSQVFFTILLAACFAGGAGPAPVHRHGDGICGSSRDRAMIGGDPERVALGLVLAGALSCAIGNVFVGWSRDVARWL